jgi:putative ABC transport system permease protein
MMPVPLGAITALRRVVRRPARTVLIVSSLALSTVFVTSLFGLQDSFHVSAIDYRLAQVGAVDEAVTGPFTTTQLASARHSLATDPHVAASSTLVMSVGVPLWAAGHSTPATSAYLYGAQPDFDQVYGPLTGQRGHPVEIADLRPGQVVLSASAASRSGARVGQTVHVTFDELTLTARVTAVLDNDPVFTAGELNQNIAVAGVFAPQAALTDAFVTRYHHQLPADALLIRDSNADTATSIAVLHHLQAIFGVAPIDPAAAHGTHAPTYFDTTLIHPLQPVIVDYTGGLSLLSSKNEYIASPAARQANWLQPAFTVLLTAAGLLLLVLECVMLARERRTELGISRALGLQRRSAATSLLLEGFCYAVLAVLAGVPLGDLATHGEIALLNTLPTVSLTGAAPFQFATVHFHAALRWQSALVAAVISLLATTVLVGLIAAWTTRTSIVAAIRDLDEPRHPRPSVQAAWRHLVAETSQATILAHETPGRRRERHRRAFITLSSAMARHDALPVLAGAGLVVLAAWLPPPGSDGLVLIDPAGIRILGVVMMIVGATPPLARGIGRLTGHPCAVHRSVISLAAAVTAVYGLYEAHPFLRAMFVPDLAAAGITHTGPYSLLAILLELLVPLGGTLVVVLRNADLAARVLSATAARIRPLAPISRTSLAHVRIHRARVNVTVTLFATVAFLVVLLLGNYASAHQQADSGAGPYTGVLTAYLTTYLSLGVIFGMLAVGVIASQAVIERGKEVGTLRAIGFTRRLVRRSFLLETSYLASLGLVPATVLGWCLLTWITAGTHTHPPALATLAVPAGGWLGTIVATLLPARAASRIAPAQALRTG